MSQEGYIKYTIIKNPTCLYLAGGAEVLSEVMGEGCESQRSRWLGSDWVIVESGALGEVSSIVMDTNHFSDHFPKKNLDLLGIHAPLGDLLSLSSEDMECKSLVDRTKLSTSTEHRFCSKAHQLGRFLHVKLCIYQMMEFVVLKSIENSLAKPEYNDAYQLSH